MAAVVGGHVSPSAIALGTLCGSASFGIWWFYAALAAGPISVVSPLAAVVVAAIPVIAGVALGERPGVVAAAGIVLALIAVVLISRHVGDRPLARPASNPGGDTNQRTFTKRVAWLTVGTGVAFGLTLVVIREAPVDAALWPLVFARMSASMLAPDATACWRWVDEAKALRFKSCDASVLTPLQWQFAGHPLAAPTS